MIFGLPFREVWAVDFEFIATEGDRPQPVCMVAREMGTHRLVRLWQNEFPAQPPFDVCPDVLVVAYFASAELGCFLQLGWPLPARVLDLYVEFRNETNGTALPSAGLLGALAHHGIPAITADQKHDERALVLRGGPWTEGERRRILDYCQSDVDVLAPLLERMLPRIRAQPRGLGQALLRGRYMRAVARMEHVGVPVDAGLLHHIRDRWEDIKLSLVQAVDLDYGLFEGTTFKAGRFAAWLTDQNIAWPRTDTGRLSLSGDTFRDMAKTYPQVEPLHQLRHSLGELRLESLAVGPDSRNRTLLSPFQARTGRNQPSSTQFVFGPSVWVRNLIRPAEANALAYIDWSAQEVAIAAHLSGDPALLRAVTSGDPYLTFAKLARLAPADATKDTHPTVREMCKKALLGANYGMGARALAYQIGRTELEARELLRRRAQTFPVYTAWAEHVIDTAMLTGHLNTVFGWTVRVTGTTRPTSLRNFPMQANGAEMLRLACCLATEAGVRVCAPVHDAVLIESPSADLDDTVATTRAAMAEASRLVLDGLEVATDARVVRWPGRYADPRGERMWREVTGLLAHRAEIA